MAVRDKNDRPLAKSIQREGDGWGVNVWMSSPYGFASDNRRYVYETHKQAKHGDISDDIGMHGRIS